MKACIFIVAIRLGDGESVHVFDLELLLFLGFFAGQHPFGAHIAAGRSAAPLFAATTRQQKPGTDTHQYKLLHEASLFG